LGVHKKFQTIVSSSKLVAIRMMKIKTMMIDQTKKKKIKYKKKANICGK
jgi:hypothetical protein